MKYVAVIAAIAAVPFTIIALHDPDATVRIWAVVGMVVSVVAATIGVTSIAPPPGSSNR